MTSVEQTEHRLAKLLAGVRLVCELDLEGADYLHARAAMQELLGRGYQQRLGRLYPATTVFFLVAEGVHHYDGGSYWPELSIEGISPNWMGPTFLAALERLDLPTYEEETEAGFVYVSKILLHGGLPRYCAGDVIRRLIEELRWGVNDARDLVTAWRHSQSRLVGLDKPARRFLLHGGDEAVDLIDRVIDLVRSGAAGEPLDPDRLGVPRYLVETYLELSDEDRRLATGTRPPRPTVSIDPLSGDGPELMLPTVASLSTWKQWHITTRGSMAGAGHATPTSELRTQEVLLEPPGPWRVVVDGPNRRAAYEFRGVDRVPVLFFEPDSGRLLREQERLSSKEVLAVSPRDTEFRAGSPDGDYVPAIRELPPLTGSWSRHVVRHLDLRGIPQVWIGSSVGAAGLPAPSAFVRVAAPADRPHLLGPVVDGLRGPNDETVYGAWPTVAIPTTLDPGRLRYRATIDGSDVTGQLRELAEADGTISLARLAPGTHVASVVLDVLGPLGTDLRDERFIVIGGAQLDVPASVLPPDAPAEIRLEADAEVLIGARTGGGVFPVAARVHELNLSATCGRHSADVRVVIPRLAWAFRRAGIAEVFRDESDSIGLDDIKDGHLDAVLVRTRRPTSVELALETPRGERLQSLGPHTTTGRDGRWVFDLKGLIDTAHVSDYPRLSLNLVVRDTSTRAAVLHARHTVTNLEVQSLTDDSGTTLLSARWSENRAFAGRQLRLWPTTRPWERPVCMPIPDGTEGELEPLVVGGVPPGSYVGEVVVADEWTSPVRPRFDRSDIARVDIGTSADRRRHVGQLDPANPYEYLELLLAREAPSGHEVDLSTDVLGELIAAAIELVVADPKGTPMSESFEEIRRVLFVEPDRLPATILALHDDGRVDVADLLRLSIATLTDALDCPLTTTSPREREQLMSIAPVLGLALDGRPTTEEARLRWLETAGWAPSMKGDSLPAPGGPIQPFMLEWDFERIARIRDVLDLTETGLLSGDGMVDAMLTWLQRSHQQEARRWQDAYHVFNDARARQSEDHVRFLDAITPPPGSPSVARFPVELLAAAIHLTGFGLRNDAALPALLSAIDIAPKLVARSLMVAIVLHRRFS